MTDPSSPPPPSVGRATTAVLGLLGCLAIVVAWFLPWTTLTEEVRNALDLRREDASRVDEEARLAGWDESRREAVRRLHEGGSVDGRTWVALIDHASAEHAAREGGGVESRAWRAVVVVLRVLPWLAGALALGVLLRRLRPLTSPVLAGLLVLSVSILSLAALLVLGSSQAARDAVRREPGALGPGLYALVAGALLAFVAGLFGVRRTNWWKAYLLAVAVLAGAGFRAIAWVRP